jgi:hypothetical protein
VDLLLQLGRRDEAAARFAQATSEPELQQSADPNLAYLAVRVGDDRSALSIFNRARDQSRLPDTALRDGAYAASRLAENDQSIDYFKQAIAAAHDGRLAMTPQQQYETRREVADRDRSWGINTLLGYRGISLGAAGAQPGLYGDVAQLVSEVYWRPQSSATAASGSCTAAQLKRSTAATMSTGGRDHPGCRRYSCQAAERSQPHTRGRTARAHRLAVQQRLVAAHGIFGRHGYRPARGCAQLEHVQYVRRSRPFYSSQAELRDVRKPKQGAVSEWRATQDWCCFRMQSWALITTLNAQPRASKAQWALALV